MRETKKNEVQQKEIDKKVIVWERAVSLVWKDETVLEGRVNIEKPKQVIYTSILKIVFLI